MPACGCASTRSSQSLALIEQILDRLPPAPIRADPRRPAGSERGEGLALVEGFRGDILAWVRLAADGSDRALPPARSLLVPVAAAGGGHRGQHRRRLPALQQILQLLLLGPRPVRGARCASCCSRACCRPPLTEAPPSRDDAALAELAAQPGARRRAAGSAASLSIREVDAGSCNGCELEIHALNNAFYDLERFGLRFVASPRHADVLLVTGPVTKNMREALERTYAATPDPKWVVAVGDCALDGGAVRRQLRRASAASPPSSRSISTSAAARRRPPRCSRG